MKRSILLTICLLIAPLSYGQDSITVQESKDYELISLLNDIKLLQETENDVMRIRVFKVENASGSAGFASGEITHMLYVTTSEFAEVPYQKLFIIGPFYNPKVSEISDANSGQKLTVEYGGHDNRIKRSYAITLRGVEEIK
jgi:hypothetical protein